MAEYQRRIEHASFRFDHSVLTELPAKTGNRLIIIKHDLLFF